MRRDILPPYFHPTRVMFVDDNLGFMRSVTSGLPDSLCFDVFLTPEEALKQVNQPHSRPQLMEECFSVQDDLWFLDLNVLEHEIKRKDRFERLSVVLIDYAMPTMNGLEFSAQIADKDLRRVLLTGVADEKTAVQAFNDGLIDQYVPKTKLARPGGLMPYIEEMQRRYFEQFMERTCAMLNLPPPEFSCDPAFKQRFFEIVRTQQVVEYYFVTNPTGYLMLRSDGSMLRLVVDYAGYVDKQCQLVRDYGIPETVARRIAQGDIPYFYEHPRDYLGNEKFPWDEFVFTGESANTWRFALVQNPPADIDFEPTESSYDVFLEGWRQSGQ